MRSQSNSNLISEEKKSKKTIERTQQMFFKPKDGEAYSITQTTTVTVTLDQKQDGCFDFLKSCFKKK